MYQIMGKKRLIFVVGGFVGAATILVCGGILFSKRIHDAYADEMYNLLDNTDHPLVLKACDDLWSSIQKPAVGPATRAVTVEVDDPIVPKMLRELHPREITVCADFVLIRLGGNLKRFSLTAFQPGAKQSGNVKVYDRFWLNHEPNLQR